MSRAEDIFNRLVYFGEDAIDEFILDLQTEELFLDFKKAASTGQKMYTLHRDDRKNLAKAISGFGNSEGGVIVWGVECSRDVEIGDVAKAKVKVKNVHRFLSWLEGAISGCTLPSHNKVRNHIIASDANGDGYIATYIPKSETAPLMSTVGNRIYIRSGSNNVPAPYSVIAGMFGKRPQPNIDLIIENKKIEIIENADEDVLYPKSIDNPPEKYVKISFMLAAENNSNAIAREIYLSCNTRETGGDYNKVRFSANNQMDSVSGIEGQINLISRADLRLPPRGMLKFTDMSIVLAKEEIDEDFNIMGVIGAENAAPKDFRIRISQEKLKKFITDAFNSENHPRLLNEFFDNFFERM